ncbi:hypothetical protein PENSPDRAFT_654589 [Peniophora sp. CONT]|nr:hypothetical protein PENSPDRAFT_654589 [Peniophora sp. CONT]
MSIKPLPAQMSDHISKAGDMAIASYLDLLQSRIGPLDLEFPQSPGAAEDAFNRIERELEANKRAVRLIGHRRNALLPILNRVPSEVLSLVFSWLSQLEPFATTRSSNRNIGWAKVTHVCQEFRRIALESPSLWTNITDDFASTPWCQIHIQRSKQVPLSLRLSSSRNIPTSSLGGILASGRVMELDLGPSSKPHIPEVAAFLLNPPATLCHLHARGVLTRSGRYKMVLFDDNRSLPLRSLRLSLVDFRWTTIGTFAQLSRLYLEGFDPEKHPAAASSSTNKFGSWISFNDCMDFLPHLTSLVLRYCLPNSEFECKRPIDMTKLEELYIVDRAEETLHSLSIIAVPEEARLRLRCLIRENTREDIIQTLVNKFFEHLVLCPTPARRLLISESSRRYRAKTLSQSRRSRPAIHEPTPSSAMYADKALSSIFLVHGYPVRPRSVVH